MKHKKLKASVVFLLLSFGGLHAQSALPATGGNASGTGGTTSYSVGQVFYLSVGTNGSVAQGVQQPYAISTITGIPQAIGIELSVYPNPATDLLNLNVGNYDNGILSYQLYDLQGQLLENKKIVEGSSTVIMESLPSSTYILKITDNRATVKMFRIIKN